jgi:phosphatidylserine decarboxylase
MKVHKEGRVTLLIVALLIVAMNYVAIKLTANIYVIYAIMAVSLLLYLFVMFFFRVVNRQIINDSNAVIAPCDGKVVVIEQAFEDEYLKCETIKVSIFMSPLDVHMNWYPVNGKILYQKMHKGSHITAWAPKSSTHNERSSVVIETEKQSRIMVRQIAGAVARRVVCYASEGGYAEQNGHLGFIKFGSRVDLYLPTDAVVKVKLNEQVIGTQTVIARFK